MADEPFLKTVRIRNYKSIGNCNVDLGALTLLVGRNGSGKSNFLDALRFVVDGLRTSLEHALRGRGGFRDLKRRGSDVIVIEVVLNLFDGQIATYGFEIGRFRRRFVVLWEELTLRKPSGQPGAFFRVEEGVVEKGSAESMPPAVKDRLFLVTASSLPEFRAVYDGLLAMGFYNLNPQQMRERQEADADDLLHADGSNIASVVRRLSNKRHAAIKKRIGEYVAAIVPGLLDFKYKSLEVHGETLEFHQMAEGSEKPWTFSPLSMSDGTLRGLGILVAAMQRTDQDKPLRLVGIEEPETALHPAATAALMDALHEAAVETQILVTTHSPDLLDRFDSDTDCLIVAQAEQGATVLGPADAASREAVRDHLYTPGDLLRMDQLQPDRAVAGHPGELVGTTQDPP